MNSKKSSHGHEPSSLSVAREEKSDRGEKSVFSEKVISSRRVTKVVKGGRIFSFSTLVIIASKGVYGIGTGKALESSAARKKAVSYAKKNLIYVNTRAGRTIPHVVTASFGATSVILRPAAPGKGVVAGGSVRALLESIGLKDVVAKINGSSNPHTALLACAAALGQLRSLRGIASARGKSVKDVLPVRASKVEEETS